MKTTKAALNMSFFNLGDGVFSPHVPSDRRARTHTHTHPHTHTGNHRIEGRGFLTRASRGLLIAAPANWALGVDCLRNRPTYRGINPHFISHICSSAPK